MIEKAQNLRLQFSQTQMLFKEDTPQPIIFSKENPESETDKGETKNGFSKKEKEISP